MVTKGFVDVTSWNKVMARVRKINKFNRDGALLYCDFSVEEIPMTKKVRGKFKPILGYRLIWEYIVRNADETST